METSEYLKYFFQMFLFDTDTIITDEEDRILLLVCPSVVGPCLGRSRNGHALVTTTAARNAA